MIEFLLADGHRPVTDEDLDRGFEAAESQHRPPARPFEITFGEAVTAALAHEYWRVLGNITTKISGYLPSSPRTPGSGHVHAHAHINHNVSLTKRLDRYDQLQKRVEILEQQVKELLQSKKNS